MSSKKRLLPWAGVLVVLAGAALVGAWLAAPSEDASADMISGEAALADPNLRGRFSGEHGFFAIIRRWLGP